MVFTVVDDPVIIGSSMTGLLVSYSLSKQNISHILVGTGVPPEEPRLGESINECAGTEFWRLFGDEFIEYCYVKSHISILNGEFAGMLYLADPKRRLETVYKEVGGTRSGKYVRFMADQLMHLDRVGFDRALYEKVRGEAACTFIEAHVSDIQYDADSDTVVRLALSDGTELNNIKYVFDCTGPRCLIGEAAGVGTQTLSAPQRVVWTHRSTESPPNDDSLWWAYGTNLLRLDEANDGIDGISWMIPLGSTLSVGVSVDSERFGDDAMDASRVLDLLAEAYERRGIDFRSLYPSARTPINMKHCYSIRDRAYGANWLLVGGGFIQIWFPSSAGLWTATAAAGLAAKMIDEPLKYGAEYETMMHNLLPFHDHLEAMIHGDVFKTHQDVYRFWIGWMGLIPARLGDYISIARPPTLLAKLVVRGHRRATRFFIRSPRIALLLGALLTVYVQAESVLANQAKAFPAYFDPRRFRMTGYRMGLRQLWKRL